MYLPQNPFEDHCCILVHKMLQAVLGLATSRQDDSEQKNETDGEEGRCSQLCRREFRALWSITQMKSFPVPPTPQYSIHVYKPCPSFWWHTYWHLVLGWHWDWRGDVFGYIGQYPHLYFYSSVSFILPFPLLFAVRHAHPHNILWRLKLEKQHATPSHKYCGIKYIFPPPRSPFVIFHRAYLLIYCHATSSSLFLQWISLPVISRV